MNLRRFAAVPALIALAAGLIAVAGCNKKPTVPLVSGNQSPTVRITFAPIDTTNRNYYVITINWIGFDPDGRVDHFLYAIDPPKEAGQDTVWQSTTDNTITRSFPCPLPDLPGEHNDGATSTRSSDFHVFAIKAVDNLGAMSPPVVRAFWSFTIAPRVRVSVPPANKLVRYYVPPAVIFHWEGFDDDGVFTQKPVKYKFKMLTDQTEVKLVTARSDPDSVRRYYAPRNWAGWDSLPGDTTEKQFTNLSPEQEYVFVVVAFDEAGAYSPLFDFNTNMIYLRVTYAGAQNPKIGFFNEFFLYEYDQGSFRPNDPAQIVLLEVPAGRPGHAEDKLTFNWYANPATDRQGNQVGGPIRSYRWAVDITDLDDETPRTDEDTDLSHWSQKSTLVTSCRIGPYPGGETHKFYLEAEDINGLISLGTVQFTTVLATFNRPLLVVHDTRLVLATIAINTNCYDRANRPIGNWPTAAELDTFLYARGNVPWRCYPLENGQQVFSTPGLFNDYDWDSLGTNLRIQDLTIRLSTLGKYQHVVWLVDAAGATNTKPGTDATDIQGPMTSMRYMNDNRKSNTIAAYVRQGGRVWLAGGGAASASMFNFNRIINDNSLPNPRTTTFRSTDNELIPGRFIYDQGHWRSEFKLFKINGGRIRRYLGRYESDPSRADLPYGDLPVEVQLKGVAPIEDPFPPNRVGQPQSNFYQTQFDIEFLSASNDIQEDLDPGPNEDFRSTLDTLYKVTGASLQPDTGPGGLQSVAMTRYHGLENQEFWVTGFSLWSFKRSQCKALVDFVLHEVWGIPFRPLPPAPGLAMPARAVGLIPGPPRAPADPAGAARAAPLRQPRRTPATGGSRD
jgi:hypothetical protein